MKNGKSGISDDVRRRMAEITRIGNIGVREAQAENHRLGLPNIYWRDGRIVYDMPDGSVVIKDEPGKPKIGQEKLSATDRPNDIGKSEIK